MEMQQLFPQNVGVVVLNFLFDEVQDLLEFLVRNMHGRLEFALAKVEKHAFV